MDSIPTHRLDHPIRGTGAWQDVLGFLRRHAEAGTLGLFTDGDGDGTTSAAQLVLALGVPVTVHVYGLGFGPTAEGLAELLDAGCTGIALLDSGTGTAPGALAACEGKAELCIIDHHPVAAGPLPEGALVLNPHIHGGEAGESLRNATLCLLLARDLLERRLPGSARSSLMARLVATGLAGGYTDCMQDGESSLHDLLRAPEPDREHRLFHRRSAYLDSPGLEALLSLDAEALGLDPRSRYLEPAELSALTDTLGIGKWDAECEDPSLPYRLLVADDCDAVPLAARLVGMGTDLRVALDGARGAAIAGQEVLSNGFLFSELGEEDLPARYRGNAGRVASALVASSGEEGGRRPAVVALPAGGDRVKISWRFETSSDPEGLFLMDTWVRDLKASRPGLLEGGGHRYAGGLRAEAVRLDEVREALGGLPWKRVV